MVIFFLFFFFFFSFSSFDLAFNKAWGWTPVDKKGQQQWLDGGEWWTAKIAGWMGGSREWPRNCMHSRLWSFRPAFLTPLFVVRPCTFTWRARRSNLLSRKRPLRQHSLRTSYPKIGERRPCLMVAFISLTWWPMRLHGSALTARDRFERCPTAISHNATIGLTLSLFA